MLTPEILASLAELLVAVISLILTVALPLVSARIYRWTGLRIEEKHQKALHEAIATWSYSAVTRGLKPASQEALQDLTDYLTASVPDAMRALGPSAEVLIRLAGRYLAVARG